MSSPHFYQADEKFAQDVFGMKPNKEHHRTTIDINPVQLSHSMLWLVSTSLGVFIFIFYVMKLIVYPMCLKGEGRHECFCACECSSLCYQIILWTKKQILTKLRN